MPALDGYTPRAAVKSEALRPRLLGLLRAFDAMYERVSAVQAPAFDPSRLWDSLGLSDEA